MLTARPLGELLSLAVMALSLWVLLHFLTVAFGLRGLGQAFGVLLMTFLGMGLAIVMLVNLAGLTV